MDEQAYRVVQVDADGDVVSEEQVAAAHYNGALRRIKQLEPTTFRIVVVDANGNKAGEASAMYWHHSVRR